MSIRTPYPGKYESTESWLSRCDAVERRQKQEDAARWAGSPHGEGLTQKQKQKLAKAESKLLAGWFYTVTNDNKQIELFDADGNSAAIATKDSTFVAGGIDAGSYTGAYGALVLNRACSAVWGKQPNWYGVFT